MASLTRMCMKYRRVRPASSLSAMLATAQLQRATAPPHPTLFADLEDLHGRRVASTAIVDISATQQQQQQDTAALDGAVTAKQLWAASRVVSRSKEVRASLGACVVGGANTIRRVWRDYGLRPNTCCTSRGLSLPRQRLLRHGPALLRPRRLPNGRACVASSLRPT